MKSPPPPAGEGSVRALRPSRAAGDRRPRGRADESLRSRTGNWELTTGQSEVLDLSRSGKTARLEPACHPNLPERCSWPCASCHRGRQNSHWRPALPPAGHLKAPTTSIASNHPIVAAPRRYNLSAALRPFVCRASPSQGSRSRRRNLSRRDDTGTRIMSQRPRDAAVRDRDPGVRGVDVLPW
jgi:hypothetical protein